MGMERPVDQCRQKNEGAYEIDDFHGRSPLKASPSLKTAGRAFGSEELPLWRGILFRRRFAMPKHQEGHGVVLDDKGQEQPADKERAQTASTTENKTEKGKMPPQKVRKDE
jgi:hypothetical protein